MGGISLRTKILIGTIGIVFLSGMISVIFAKTVLRQNLLDKLQKRGISIARNVASGAVNPMLTEKYFELSMIIRDYMKTEDDIAYIFILNQTGEVLAHTYEGGFPIELKEVNRVAPTQKSSVQRILVEREDILDIAVPVLTGGMGVVHLGMAMGSIEADVNHLITSIISLVMAILILVGVMGIIFSRIITRPILELSRAAETVGRGNLDVWVDVHSRDEIGKLVTIFNRMIEARKKSEDEREKLIAELKTALNKVKKLSGILPICAKCKKIRDDKGYWSQVESYIREHSEAEFSHGLCPDCAEETLKEIEKIKRK